jgi:hypothetical protein
VVAQVTSPPSPYASLTRRRPVQTLGQAPATEATQAHGFSTIEKVLIISTTIAAANLLMNVYAMSKRQLRDNPMPRGATLRQEGGEWVLRFREGGSRRFKTKQAARSYVGGLAP